MPFRVDVVGWGWWDKVFAELVWGKEELVCDFASLLFLSAALVALAQNRHWPMVPCNG